MTTIAYRDGIIAADGLATRNGIIVERAGEKLQRLPNGHVVGVTGEVHRRQLFVEWYLDQSKERPDLSETSVMVLTEKGLFEYEGKCGFSQIHDKFTAWGSGSPAAMAAMQMGASAYEAVRVASEVDIYTGGAITSMRYEG